MRRTIRAVLLTPTCLSLLTVLYVCGIGDTVPAQDEPLPAERFLANPKYGLTRMMPDSLLLDSVHLSTTGWMLPTRYVVEFRDSIGSEYRIIDSM